MSFHVRVFEHGEWVDRAVDINHFISRNRAEPKRPINLRIPESAKSPTVGFLSRTVYRSPVIKWILPANIRNNSQWSTAGPISNKDSDVGPSSDIVFVGDDFIHLKQINPETGYLSHLVTEADFNSRIRAAKVFGELKQRRSSTKVPNDDKIFIKKELNDDDDSEGEVRSSAPGLPPQLIILTMESQELLFVTACKSSQKKIKFQKSAIPLPNPKSLLSKPGKHLAVDPKSRAFAVGAAAGLLVLYNAKSKKQIRDEFASQMAPCHPILNDKIVTVEGMILKMEFLCPSTHDKDRIILVLVISKDERGWLQCFEWDNVSGFQNFRRHQQQPLMTLERMPLMLVPFSKSPKFLLVTEHKLTVIENILTGSISRKLIKLPYCARTTDNNGSQNPLLLTSWARSAENSSSPCECLYLSREDGVVYYLQIFDRNIGNRIRVGNLGTRIGTTFANLNTYPRSSDVIISTGDLCDGGLFIIDIWSAKNNEDFTESLHENAVATPQEHLKILRTDSMTTQKIESIQNWSPIFDLVCNLNRDGMNRGRSSIFVTSGRAPYGAITELRFGYEAKIGGYFLEQPELSSSTGLWSIEHKSIHGVYLILAMPLQTSLLYVSANLSSVEVDFDEFNCGLDLANETVAAQDLSVNYYVQITRKTIILLDLESENVTFKSRFRKQIHPNSTISAALVETVSGLIVTAMRTDDIYTLCLHKFTDSTDQIQLNEIGQVLKIRQEAICMASFEIRNHQYVCVATAAATIEIYRIDTQIGLTPIMEHEIMKMPSADSHVNDLHAAPKTCESLVVLRHRSKFNGIQDSVVIVCGLRNGYIYCLELNSKDEQNNAEPGALIEKETYSREVGFTSVRLIVDIAKPNTGAFVMCGSDTLYLTRSRGGEAGLSLSYIWFTDLSEPSYQQDAVSALTRFRVKDLPNAIVCSSGSRFLVCQLSERKQSVPRRIPVEGSPNRLLYVAHLNIMVAASLPSVPQSTERTVSMKQKDDKPISSGSLQFISLNRDKKSPHKDHILGVYKCLDHKERIYALTEWKYEDNTGKKYYFIVLGTSIPAKSPSGAKGRVYLLRPWLYEDDEFKIVTRKVWDFREGPVYAIAFQGLSCMLVTAGKYILRLRYSSSTNRWDKLQMTQLTSPGARIAVRGPYAHVATSMDSLQSFTFEPTSESGSGAPTRTELGRVCSDGQARNSASVLPISFGAPPDTTFSKPHTPSSTSSPNQSGLNAVESTEIILLSDKAGSIAGLHFAPDERIANAAPLLFEATFSRSITVLRRGNVRPPWRWSHITVGNHNKSKQRNIYQYEQAQHNDQQRKPQGLLADDIIGSATDGTIMAGMIVNEHAWRLLSFLTRACQSLSQFSSRHFANNNMTQLSSSSVGASLSTTKDTRVRDTDVRYFKPGSHPLDVNIDPDDDVAGLRRKLAYHIDGDILARVLGSGEEEEEEEEDNNDNNDHEDEERKTGRDPIQTLTDALDGRVCSDGNDAANNGRSKTYRKDIQSTRQIGPAEYKWKNEQKERVRRIRTARWQRFDELVRKALPGAIEDLETGNSEGNNQFKNRPDNNRSSSSNNLEEKKEEGAKNAVESKKLVDNNNNDEDDNDEDDEFDDGTMEIEEAQFEMDVRWRDGSQRNGNEDGREDGEDNDDHEEEEEEIAKMRERKKVMGIVVDWLRVMLTTVD